MQLPDFLSEQPDGEILLTGHRIGLFHIIHYYNEGFSPEMLACQFPTLPLALIYKVIGWYLEHQDEAGNYISAYRAALLQHRESNPRRLDLALLRLRLESQRADASVVPADSA